MPRLLKLEGQDGGTLWINPDHVASVGAAKTSPNGGVALGYAALVMGVAAMIVKGSPDQIAKLINEFPPSRLLRDTDSAGRPLPDR